MANSSEMRRKVEKILSGSGLPWSLDHGGRHLKIHLCGRMVGILPRAGGNTAGNLTRHRNTIAQIRRAIREAKPAPSDPDFQS